MPQTDPINTMILNFVAKLKIVGAQLVKKSARSPNMSLHHNFTPETLNAYQKSVTSNFDLVGTNQYLHDSTGTNKQTSFEKAVKIPIASLDSMVSAASSIDHGEEESTGEDEDGATTQRNEDDLISNGDGSENDYDIGESDADSETDDDHPDCATLDCLDIVPLETNSIPNSNNNNINFGLNNNPTQDPTTSVQPQHNRDRPSNFPDHQTETMVEPGSTIDNNNNDRQQHYFPSSKIPFPPSYDPIGKNELAHMNNNPPDEYVERQTSSAFGNFDSIKANYWFGWLICLLLIATIIIISTNKLLIVKPNVVVVGAVATVT